MADMIDHLSAYVIPVRDLEKCVSFYRDKLGLILQVKEADFAYLIFAKQDKPGVAQWVTPMLPWTGTQAERSFSSFFVRPSVIS